MPLITFDQILEYISRGHAFPKHVEGMGQENEIMENVNSFRDTDTSASPLSQARGQPRDLGPDLHINNPADLKDYMRRMVDSPDTRGFVTGRDSNIMHLYNGRDNTYMIINTLDPDMGTIHRYPDSRENFLTKQRNAQRSGEPFARFDNSQTRGAAMDQVDKLIERIDRPPYALRAAPGEVAANRPAYDGTNNLSRAGLSPEYQSYARQMDNIASIRQGLDFGAGYVASVDSDGRPGQMFFHDEAANTVTEINGRDITVYSFDNIAEADRAAVAEQFFEMNRPQGQDIIQGGYNNVVRDFQSQNNGKLPLSGNNVSRVLNDVEQGIITTADNVPYRSFGDATRAYIGFTDEQVQLFDLIPADIPANEIAALDLPPDVAEAMTNLSVAKGYSQIGEGDEIVDGLRNFSETFNGMDDATRTGVMDALGTISKTPVDDLARGSAAAVDALDATSDLAKLASSLKAGRLGLNVTKAGVVTTVAATTLAVGSTAYANTVVRDIADQLHSSGRLSDAAHEDYKKMMDDVGPMLTGQAADPFITAIPGMAIVERIAYNRFQEFSNEHQLPQDIHEMLSPSIVAGTSLRADIGQDTFRYIPEDPSAVSEPLRALVEAKNAQISANDQYWDTYSDNRPPAWQAALMDSGMGMGGGFGKPPSQVITEMSPEVIEAQGVLDTAKQNFQTEFDRVLSDPEAARALADTMDEHQLFEVIKQTAKYNSEGQDPLIQQYVEAQEADAAWYDLRGAWNNWRARDNAEEALRANPDVMREYLSGIFVPENAPAPEASPVEVGIGQETDYEADPHYMMVASAFEKEQEGGELDDYDREQIQQYIDQAVLEGQTDIVAELQTRYPEQMAEFMQCHMEDTESTGGIAPDLSTENTIPVGIPMTVGTKL